MNLATAHVNSMNRASVNDSLRERLRGDGLDWIVPDWDAPSNVGAFMTTRNGDAAREGGFDVGGADMPIEQARVVAEHRRRIEAYLPAAPRWLTQIHGADVVEVDGDDPGYTSSADAAVTRRANVVLTVRVADCMPVLFATRDGGVVGIAHAGWRGLARGVLERTLQSMRCDPRDVRAWLGPAIGATAFEVGADVFDAFVAHDEDARGAFAPLRPGKWLADLEAIARRRLARAGVRAIAASGLCTYRDPERFFSYRRDGSQGRMAAFIWRAKDAPTLAPLAAPGGGGSAAWGGPALLT
ncbi:MAG TPA: peptidoglycan editing factor PgeF [Casimicrobiaceae bacterium]